MYNNVFKNYQGLRKTNALFGVKQSRLRTARNALGYWWTWRKF